MPLTSWKHPLLQDKRPVHELHYSTRRPIIGGVYKHVPTKAVYIVVATGTSVEDVEKRQMDYIPEQVVLESIDTQEIIMMDTRRMAELDKNNRNVWVKQYSEGFVEDAIELL